MDQNVNVRISATADNLQAETSRASSAVRNFASQIKQASRESVQASHAMSQGMGQSSDKAGDATNRMGTRIKAALRGAVGVAREFGIGFREGMLQAVSEADIAADKITKDMRRMKGAGRGGGIGGAVAGLGIGAAAVGAGAGVISTIAQYEKLGATLKTFTGSQAAANAQLQELARMGSSTPYQLSELTQGFITLKARGLDNSIPSLTAYGNMASSLGVDFQIAIEAVADAANGQFARLESMGIGAVAQGDNVALSFNGITTTVKNNKKEIEKYLLGLSNTNFAGAMAEQAATLAGQWSNTQDVAAGFAAAVGAGGLSGALQGVLRDINGAGAGAQSFGLIVGQNLGQAITTAWAGLKQFNSAVQPMVASLQPAINAFVGLGRSIIGALGPVVKAALAAIIPAIRAVIPAIAPLIQAVDALFKQFMATFGPAIISIITSAVNVVKTVILSMASVVKQVVDAVTALLRGDFMGAWNGLKGAVGAAMRGVLDIIGSVFRGIIDLLKTIGSQIIDGLVQGFNGARQRAIDAVKGLGRDIAAAFRGVLGISSPSKVFEYYGHYTTEGFAKGLRSGTADVIKAVRDMARGSIDAMKSAVNTLLESLLTDAERGYRQYADNVDLLNIAHRQGTMTADELTAALDRLNAVRERGRTGRADITKDNPPIVIPEGAEGRRRNPYEVSADGLPDLIEAANKTETFAQRVRGAFEPVRQGVASLFENMITGAQSWQDIVLKVGQNILQNLSQVFADMAIQWVQHEILKTGATAAQTGARVGIEAAGAAQSTAISATSTLAKIGHNAFAAAAGAYSAIAAIPIVGPVLAPIAAAAALAGVLALGKSIFSARGGFGKVPHDGAITELHKNEMVLPAYIASPLRAALASGGASMPSVGLGLSAASRIGQSGAAAQAQQAQEMATYIAAQGGGAGRGLTIKTYGARDLKRMLESGAPFVKRSLERLARDGVT